MRKFFKGWHSWAAACVLALLVLFPASSAFAIDKVVLKDGSVVEGTIVREVDGIIWIKTRIAGVDQEKLYTPQEISSIQRDAAATPVSSEPVILDTKPAIALSGAPRAAVITLGSREKGQGSTIGIDIQAHELREMLPLLESELGTDGTGVVVIRITSGGGLLLEIQRLSDVIHNDYKKRFRTVAWIDSAISAAAMTSHCIEEIYFTSNANYGACTGYSGPLVAVKGWGLEEVLQMMEKISARGGYNPLIMRAMQIQVPLSATVDPNGEVLWYADSTSGDIVVNRDTEILTFNAHTAKKVKFSRGTADSTQELQALMGYKELQWVGKPQKGYLWPISKAEAWNIKWREGVHEDQENMQLYFATYNRQVQAAASEPRETRGKFVNMARTTLNKIKEAAKRNPNMALLTFNVFTEQELRDLFDREEKKLRDLMK